MPDDPHYQPDNPEASPISGYIPPVHTRWKPGQSGNPKGRARSAGTSMKEWLNQFAESELTEAQLRKIARDKSAPWTKRAAAERVLRTLEAGDMADFEGFLEGGDSLASLREKGVNTEVIKKIKQKSRVVPTGEDSHEEIIERDIELHDRGGDDFDRIMDRTEGRPALIGDPDDDEAEQKMIRVRRISKPQQPTTDDAGPD